MSKKAVKVKELSTRSEPATFLKFKVNLLTNFSPFYSEIFNSLQVRIVNGASKGDLPVPIYLQDKVMYIKADMLKDRNKNNLMFILLSTLTQMTYGSIVEKVNNKPLACQVAKIISNAYWQHEYENPSVFQIDKSEMVDVKFAKATFKEVYLKYASELQKLKKMGILPNIAQSNISVNHVVDQALLRQYSSTGSDGYGAFSMPKDLIDIVAERTNPQISWTRVLMNQITEKTTPKKDVRVFSRRMLARGVNLPGKSISDCAKKIVVFVDTSGSMSVKDLEIVYSELVNVLLLGVVSEIEMMCFSNKLYKPITLDKDVNFNSISFQGGGGTVIEPVIEMMITGYPKDTLFLVFTDMYFNLEAFKKIKVKLPIYWVTRTLDVKAPTGDIIYIK